MAPEILIDDPMGSRGKRMLKALAEAGPPGTLVTKTYSGTRDLLVLYGPGSDRHVRIRRAHRGPVVMWDLGYWDREESMRLAINTIHPTKEQLELSEGSRRDFELREYANPIGPILLTGMGSKSAHMYGLYPFQWERKKLKELKARFPNKQILWRPKGRYANEIIGTKLCHGTGIEEALNGCSLVVCRHSNVAVDACVHGVPVECEGGAAYSLYHGNQKPSRQDRMAFMQRLSWWNWKPSEAPQAWDWINKVLNAS